MIAKTFWLCFFLLLSVILVRAQQQQELPLWTDGAPGALGKTPFDIPTITPYLPDAGKATGAALIICPGGGYGGLAPHEGDGYAKWFIQHGITCFVLKYRLGSHGYHHPTMMLDAGRAIRTVRAEATKWGVDPKRVGIIGSSAGGHLASTMMTHFDAGNPASPDPIERVSDRPDIGILCYAVITMTEPFAQGGSKKNLLGDDPSPELIDLMSSEKQVTKETPPCFIWQTWEDTTVRVENTFMFVEALRAHGVPFDLHVYQIGKHGMGLGKNADDPTKLHPWTDDCLYWLNVQGFLTPSSAGHTPAPMTSPSPTPNHTLQPVSPGG